MSTLTHSCGMTFFSLWSLHIYVTSNGYWNSICISIYNQLRQEALKQIVREKNTVSSLKTKTKALLRPSFLFLFRLRLVSGDIELCFTLYLPVISVVSVMCTFLINSIRYQKCIIFYCHAPSYKKRRIRERKIWP